jgi:hypothetical protein
VFLTLNFFKIIIDSCSKKLLQKHRSQDSLTKYSFLCPNGTLFQQQASNLNIKIPFFIKNEVSECRLCFVQYFVCDWWFNVDCSTAVSFYLLNEQIAAERAENSPPGTAGGQYEGRPATTGAAKNGQTGAAPASVGGYARYCEDFFYEKYNSDSIQSYKVVQSTYKDCIYELQI